MIHEFADPIEVETPLGRGHAIFVESAPHDYYWTVVMRDNQAIVTFCQNKLRFHRSYTHERGIDDERMKDIIKRET